MAYICSAAEVVLQRIGGEHPPRGTGPWGAPGGSRWTSVADVLVWNAKSHTDVDATEWNTADDERVRVRSFNPEQIPLRDYQLEACDACTVDYDNTFKSGCVVMGCGDGKSRVAAELIRRSRAPSVVLAPHSVSVEQWVDLIRTFVTSNVTSLGTARSEWKYNMPLPDVVVTTYHSLVRVTKTMMEHRQALMQPNQSMQSSEENIGDRLIMMLMCERFGVLVMDEVHMAVADHFISAGCLRCSVVYGLSGSLIREDERIGRLMSSVGPTLYTHFTRRSMTITVVTVPMSTEHQQRLEKLHSRSKWEQTFRALNPHKLYALDEILGAHSGSRIIVFCDVMRAAEIIHATHPNSLLMTGRDRAGARDDTLSNFSANPSGVLICTRICDASINFPPGCVIVQHHLSNASRQQEVQRCGRGTRDISNTMAYMYHIANGCNDEITYVNRRIQHLHTFMDQDSLTVVRYTIPFDVQLSDTHLTARERMLIITLPCSRTKSANAASVQTRVAKMMRHVKHNG